MPKTLNNFDTYITQALADWHIPGAAVAITKGDEVLHSGGYGLRDIKQGLPVTANTRFPIASMTKPFTAMGAAILVDEGLLDWDQPIRDVMPDFRLHDDYATQHANLRDLLSHRTGLPRHDSTWYGSDRAFEAILPELRHLEPTAPFRSQWQYNNLMYETVGLLCARLTDSNSWYDFVQQRILDPLGLNHTTPNHLTGDKQFDDIALPYRLKNGDDQPQLLDFYENPLGPAGSIHSTLNDVVTWLKVHTQGGQGNGVQLVSPHTLKQMHTPHTLMPATPGQEMMFNNALYAYGLAWFIEPYQGVTLLHHGGNINGFSVMGAFVPQEDIAIVVLTNIDGKGLRGALMYEALDRALEVNGNDWSAEMLKRNNETVQAALAAEQYTKDSQTSTATQAPASHPLCDYAGSYKAKGYDALDIRYDNNALSIKYYGEWWPLNHLHYDVFEMDMRSRFDSAAKVSFSLDNFGFITRLNIPAEPDLGDMPFKRQPITLPPTQQAALAGPYSYPLEGQSLEVLIEEEKLYLAITGKNKTALHCVDQQDQSLSFKLEGNDSSVLEFVLEGGEVKTLLVNHPGALYRCVKAG